MSLSHHVLHLTPRRCDHQSVFRTALTITPTPTTHDTGVDYFGNPVSFITLQHQHKHLTLHARSVIAVQAVEPPEPLSTVPWDLVFDRLNEDTSDSSLDALQYAFESPQTHANDDIRAYTKTMFPHGRPLLDGVLALTRGFSACSTSIPPRPPFPRRWTRCGASGGASVRTSPTCNWLVCARCASRRAM